MNQQPVPEFQDAGYWYVVGVKTDPETGSLVPDMPENVPFAQWMNDGTRCVIRVLTPIAGLEQMGRPSELLPIPRKPYARLGGK